MEIHSSSLTAIPAGYNTKSKSDESRPINIIEKNDNIHNQESLTVFPAEQLSNSLSFISKDFQQLINNIEQPKDQPSNSRTARAINSYTQENIKPLKDQRSELISRIDYFV